MRAAAYLPVNTVCQHDAQFRLSGTVLQPCLTEQVAGNRRQPGRVSPVKSELQCLQGTVVITAERDRCAERQDDLRSEEHTSELQSRGHLVCRLLLEKKNTNDT